MPSAQDLTLCTVKISKIFKLDYCVSVSKKKKQQQHVELSISHELQIISSVPWYLGRVNTDHGI